jgi:hypothetical protein
MLGPFGRSIYGQTATYVNTGRALSSYFNSAYLPITISTWVYISSGQACPAGSSAYTGVCLFSDESAYFGAFRYNKSGTGDRIHFYSWSGSGEKTISIPTPLDQWVHLSFVRYWTTNNTTVRWAIWQDGVCLVDEAGYALDAINRNLFLFDTSYASVLLGAFDHFMIHDRPLTGSEIRMLANGNTPDTLRKVTLYSIPASSIGYKFGVCGMGSPKLSGSYKLGWIE